MKFSVATIFIYLCLLQGMQTLSGDINFDLENPTGEKYASFMTELRQQASDKGVSYSEIPMIPAPPSPPAYHIVVLRITDDVSVKIALNRSNLYVVGYCDQFEGKSRAHFFKDAPPNAITDLFKEATSPLRYTLPYVSSYSALQEKAGVKDRRKAGLGIGKWKNLINAINNQEIDEIKEATFLLLTVQMLSEAARFKYIEKQISQNLQGFTPDYKVTSLENEWGKITQTITDSKDGKKLSQTVSFSDPSGKPVKVTTVKEIAPDMGLLCYYVKVSKPWYMDFF